MKKSIQSVKEINEQKYKHIMKLVSSHVKKLLEECEQDDNKDLDEDDEIAEQALNELFGIGSDVKKPEVALSVDNTDEKNAEIFIQWCEYYISKSGNNMSNAVAKVSDACKTVLVKTPIVILKGILMVLSRTVKLAKSSADHIASLVVVSYCTLVKLIKSGIKEADQVLTKLKDLIINKVKGGYNSFKENTEKIVNEASDKFTIWFGIASAITIMVADKIEGAADAFGDWVKSVVEDATKKVNAAIMLVKTWLSSNANAVKDYLISLNNKVKSVAIDVWNKLDSKVRKAYNKIAGVIEKWMTSLKDIVTEIGKKIDTAKENTKSFVIDKKDKTLLWNIQKSVKALSNKFKEEEVVALVRKCYNESLKPNKNGNYLVNEAYFYERGSHKRKLYEKHKQAIKRNMILS